MNLEFEQLINAKLASFAITEKSVVENEIRCIDNMYPENFAEMIAAAKHHSQSSVVVYKIHTTVYGTTGWSVLRTDHGLIQILEHIQSKLPGYKVRYQVNDKGAREFIVEL